jgi:hypothetical protein
MNTEDMTRPSRLMGRLATVEQGTMKSRNLRPGPKPAPYRFKPFCQGHLDPLCGVYAMINALRLLTRPGDGLDLEFWEGLFCYALARVDRLFGIRRMLNDGTPLWLSKALLPVVLKRFESGASIGVQAQTLPELAAGKPPSDHWDLLRRELEDRTASALVLLGGESHHWTVVRSVTAGAIWLFDSDGFKSILRAEIAPSYRQQGHRRFVVSTRPIRLLTRS